jgi:hypothetical protein
MRHRFDKSSKWLIQKHGDGILYLGGIRGVRRWRALQAELVQPTRLPDGLLEVFFHSRDKPDYFLVEVATYPEKRISQQALHDLTLALEHLGVLPEMITLVLNPRGQLRVAGSFAVESRLRWSRLTCSWKVVELWAVPAEDLLAGGNVGLLPWVPLTQFQGPPRPLLEECRKRIDKQARPDERDNLLAVSQVLAQLRYNDPDLLAILGGKQIMIESPLINQIVAEARQEDILKFLQARFDSVPDDVSERLRAVRGEKKLVALIKHAARCRDINAFRKRLPN